MGSNASANDEGIELFNPHDAPICDLARFVLVGAGAASNTLKTAVVSMRAREENFRRALPTQVIAPRVANGGRRWKVLVVVVSLVASPERDGGLHCVGRSLSGREPLEHAPQQNHQAGSNTLRAARGAAPGGSDARSSRAGPDGGGDGV
jgi:hypothetical protein